MELSSPLLFRRGFFDPAKQCESRGFDPNEANEKKK
jgi:hypothetical protein